MSTLNNNACVDISAFVSDVKVQRVGQELRADRVLPGARATEALPDHVVPPDQPETQVSTPLYRSPCCQVIYATVCSHCAQNES